MSKDIERLIEVLEGEAALYGELEELLALERKAIRKMDMATLEGHLGTKAVVLGRMRILERERADLVSAIAAAQSLPEESRTLLELTRRLPAPWAGRMMEVRDRLRGLTGSVAERNESNRSFVGGLIRVMDGVVESIRQAVADPPVYGEKGKMGPGSLVGGGILRRAV